MPIFLEVLSIPSCPFLVYYVSLYAHFLTSKSKVHSKFFDILVQLIIIILLMSWVFINLSLWKRYTISRPSALEKFGKVSSYALYRNLLLWKYFPIGGVGGVG
uniref:Uncharacterized protein n=1 Tax=Cacopsylla melanoneura TaxID=428564 RepID=A0A8D8Z7S7_9HEMI